MVEYHSVQKELRIWGIAIIFDVIGHVMQFCFGFKQSDVNDIMKFYFDVGFHFYGNSHSHHSLNSYHWLKLKWLSCQSGCLESHTISI